MLQPDIDVNVSDYNIHGFSNLVMSYCITLLLLYPRYEVYRGYIVFASSVIMFVCLSGCL